MLTVTTPNLSCVLQTFIDRFYIALFSAQSRADSLLSYRMWFWMSDCILLSRVFVSNSTVVLTVLFGCNWLVPPETAATSVHVPCAPYNHALVYRVTSLKATYVGCVCAQLQPATCTFGGMTWIFFIRATFHYALRAITRGRNGYRNRTQHRKLTLEKKYLPLLLPRGLEPEPFRSVTSPAFYNHWLSYPRSQ